jgi:hypothetical protein
VVSHPSPKARRTGHPIKGGDGKESVESEQEIRGAQ